MLKRTLSKELESWKTSIYRKPLVLQGARQVGKTTLINEFGKTYQQYIYLNLEKKDHKEYFQEINDIKALTQRIFFDHKLKWSKLESTLLFIDEIQEQPSAVNFLRYFFEDLPQIHVIAAGSMLENLIGKNITFPVGRVEYKTLRPFSFEEFLLAINEELAFEEYKNVPIKKYTTQRLFELFHTYSFIGGMPEIVKKYAKNQDITELFPVYQSLINSYFLDAERYAENKNGLDLLRIVIQKILSEAGNRITNKTFTGTDFKTKDITTVLNAIQKTKLIQLIYPTSQLSLPAFPDFKKSPKIQLLDTGILNFASSAHTEILATKDLNNVFKGRIIEHLVGQEILSTITFPLGTLHFWSRDKVNSSAELDYVVPYKGHLIPIEVKSGPTGTLKSLLLFLDNSPLNFGIRFYYGEFSVDKIKTSGGKTVHLFNLPYFLAGQLEAYLPWIWEQTKKEEIHTFTFREPDNNYSSERLQKTQTNTNTKFNKKHLLILKHLQEKPLTGKVILEEILNITDQNKNRATYLRFLMKLELIEWTEPENPISKTQAYRITKKGIEHLTSDNK